LVFYYDAPEDIVQKFKVFKLTDSTLTVSNKGNSVFFKHSDVELYKDVITEEVKYKICF